jgi:hypothetical protein
MGTRPSKRLNNNVYGSYPSTTAGNVDVYQCHRLTSTVAANFANMSISSSIAPSSFYSDMNIYSPNFYQQFQRTQSPGNTKNSALNSHHSNFQQSISSTKQEKPPMRTNAVTSSPWASTSGSDSSSGGNSPLKKQTNITKSKLLQELLECPICMNLFEMPTCLPCQHTFCKKCIVSLKSAGEETTNSSAASTLTENATISCPICR